MEETNERHKNRKLAKNLLTHSVSLKQNENILIEVLGEDGVPLAKELIKQAEQIGVNRRTKCYQ